MVLQLAWIALIAVLLWRWSGQLPWRGEGRGPYGGALAVAVLATGLLLVTAEPWKVLWGLALSGAHTAQALGWDPQTSLFWASPRGQVQLAGFDAWLFNDAVLVDLGLLYGAVATAIGQGRFRWRGVRPQALPELARRGFGGLLMGYGGLLASGCNVNAFLGGVMSFSLHGWIWLAVALLGFAASLRLSPAA